MAQFMRERRQKIYKRRIGPLHCDFKSLFRFNEQNVTWLAQRFLEPSEETRGGAISAVHKMKVCLRYLADPGFQKGVGEELGVNQATVCKTIHYVINKIVEKADVWIKFPSSNNDVQIAKNLWHQKGNRFPNAIGVIDCTHVEIEKPGHLGDEYINRKGRPSLNIQATCDAREVFTSVDVSWPGSVHDSRIWKNSDVRRIMHQANNAVLLGDDGYGIEPCLMTPIQNPSNGEEENYNRIFKIERTLIERCFGQLKRRFPILKYVCRVKLVNIPKVVVACFVLHNVAKFLKDEDFLSDEDEDNLEPEEQIHPSLPVIYYDDNTNRARGQAVRRQIVLLMSDNDG